ncbi:MAG: lipoyl protein ligase domain-containing protein [Acidimicrobiales bacterium]
MVRTQDDDSPAASWLVERWDDPASTAHHRALPDPLRPTIWVEQPSTRALVLGSTQTEAALVGDGSDARADGWEVTRRRSGGGLVVIDPAVTVWVDVLVPKGHPHWRDDIGRAFHWVGDAWAAALSAVLPGTSSVVHRGAAVDADVGRVVCFGGLGHGEVTIEGAKVVGLSQRRSREGARIQGLAVLHHDPSTLTRHLATPLPRHATPSDLKVGVPGLGRDAAHELVEPLRAAVVAAVISSTGSRGQR